jgi:CRISPR-associated protein Csb1
MTAPDTLTVDVLRNAVKTAAAFRCRRRLQPAGGEGDKVFPPTYAGAVYAIEKRHVPGHEGGVQCVLLDSVQSQANRMEQALQEALDAGKLAVPHIVVDFSDYDPNDSAADEQGKKLIDVVGKVTSLQVPHRLADAIIRDSNLNGTPFRYSDKGKALDRVSLANATPLFQMCPTALVFGMWDSTGPKGGLGPKFERAIVSEVVGIGVKWQDDYRARGVRRDPLEIRAAVKVVKNPDKSWRMAREVERSGKKVWESGATEPSKINHSSVPFDSKNSGVTIEYAEQITTLSLIVLRRLHFPVNGVATEEGNLAARTVLAALGLAAATMAFESGMGLRSRCLLWPDGLMTWELLDKPGKSPKAFALTSDQATDLLGQAVEAAEKAGLPWPTDPVTLKPSDDLVELARRSQLEAIREEADTGGQ